MQPLLPHLLSDLVLRLPPVLNNYGSVFSTALLQKLTHCICGKTNAFNKLLLKSSYVQGMRLEGWQATKIGKQPPVLASSEEDKNQRKTWHIRLCNGTIEDRAMMNQGYSGHWEKKIFSCPQGPHHVSLFKWDLSPRIILFTIQRGVFLSQLNDNGSSKKQWGKDYPNILKI